MRLESFVSDNFWRKIIEKQIKKIPENLILALDQLYKDNWDIDIDKLIYKIKSECEDYSTKEFNVTMSQYKIYIPVIIKLGNMTISNGANKHNITDLYITLNLESYFNSNSVRFNNIKGIRTSASIEELKYNYFHSHLSGKSKTFQEFCLGSNYDLRDYFTYIHTQKTVEDFLLMLFTVKQSLSWESLSGTPYKYLERIGKEPLAQDISNYIFDQLLKKLYFTNLKFKITDNNIKVLFTKELEQQIFDQIKSTNYDTYTCYKTEFGEYLSTTHSTANKNSNTIKEWENADMFIFKKEMLKFRITNLIQQENVTENNAPNPKLTEGIIDSLSKAITKKHITNSRIKTKNITEDSKEYSETD